MTLYNKRRLLTFLGLLSVAAVGLELHSRLLTRLWRLPQVPQENARQEEEIPQGFARYPWYKWEPHPTSELPATIRKVEGKISLKVGGYGSDTFSQELIQSGRAPIYLINDSDHDLQVPSQDGDIYLRLEAKLDDGRWHRAQFHQHSGCGNSYIQHDLPAHQFVCIFGHSPSSGKRSYVRYAIHNGADDILVTDEFDGHYSTDDLTLSEFDDMALSEADVLTLRSFLLRESRPSLLHYNQRLEYLRATAWHSLTSGKHDLDAAISAAKEIQVFDPTLSVPGNLEVTLKTWTASRQRERAELQRLHGFYFANKTVSGAAKPHQNKGTP
ncbi:MAG: hypothetical protein ACKVY0_20895 [Prosthecobacter sp.]|uniref:hypothetical protein n=1 Tax=Prosthecobacter sp. TaxID=1965333 RepID=UPI003901AEF7